MGTEKIGQQEFEEIHAKEELKKNTGKLAKAVGGNARIALVLALTMLQGGKASEVHEIKETQEEEAWWIRPLITLVCLAMVGALSLTRWLWEKGRQWFNGRRVHNGRNVEGEEPEEEQQPQQVEHETDIEKVNMQWQIVRLEVALAEKDEYLKEMTEEKDRMMHEYLRFADMNVNLRGQLEDLREENLGLTNRLLRRGGGHDEKEQEIQRLDEEIKQLKEVNVLLKARIDEMNQASNSRLKESLDGVKFEMERKQWMMTHSGECYHSETCSHVANRAKKVIRPCPYCVPTTMRAVTGFEVTSMSA